MRLVHNVLFLWEDIKLSCLGHIKVERDMIDSHTKQTLKHNIEKKKDKI